jgi:hypothetical protein
MRSFDRYRERYQKNTQSVHVEKNKPIKGFNFTTFNPNYLAKKYPIFLSDSIGESDKEKFERFIRQLNRAIYSCSLCERGNVFFEYKNLLRDPHFVPSMEYKNIAIIKYEPNDDDINELISIKNRDLFYITSIIKCAGKVSCECPYFDLEIKALSKIWFKLIILLDEKSSNYFGIEYTINSSLIKNGCKYMCCDYNDETFKKLISGMSNHLFRKHLLTF